MTFLAGIGVGYLIGSKAGREKIKSLWNDPKVQDTVNQGTEWAKQKAPVLQDKVTDAAKDAASSAKDAASSAKSSVSSSNGGSGSGSGSGSSGSGSTGGGSSAGASTVAGSSNPADRSHTSGGNYSMDPAKPQPDGR
ncbi:MULTISPECIES: hypothetical protein [Arthrobacter]|uniref:hypothetical protein n=1 Tax=Arthrobacter TaxID=1663 RepID=UPI00128F9F09|nr:hypothetical protein [Arthrobacter sp. Edens01]